MTSQRPCWRSQTKEQQPYWRSEIFFWELNSIFMKIIPFVVVCKYGCWSHEQQHSIGGRKEVEDKVLSRTRELPATARPVTGARLV